MSNFTGVTFSQQKVLPSDDAIIRRSILSDGVLYGCEFSYSGYTLTMGSGQMLICGRQIRHPSAQNWAVNDATSGFARLVLTVDLTRTASKDVFDQVVDSIEYATDKDGFSELVQTDVNVSGTRYQVAACIVSLGSGGITGIVEQLGPCEASGGGGLNFKAVGSLTQPANPAENTIWVATDIPISGYAFSATEPAEPAEGLVWFLVKIPSTVKFNALKKEALMVYPVSAKQYNAGAWVDKTAKSYQGSAWVDWFNGKLLYIYGDECIDTTGGWSAKSYSKLIKTENYMEAVQTNDTYSAFAGTNKSIDLTNIARVEIEYAYAYGHAEAKLFVQTGPVPSSGGTAWSKEVAYVGLAKTGGLENYTTVSLDTTGVSGLHYVYFMTYEPMRVKSVIGYS